ncbi:RLA class II histocompatibility antigen, DP alpha-1 chain-like [Tiliqua scincoides]|uniref:RLA class II histocompatibility antigen, DP alpha-1 chain-like n=1 Tax=Tiliqua scincoides TaxID=71010 RepID=UPI003462FC02
MGSGEEALVLPLCLLVLFALPGAAPVAVEDTYMDMVFFQESFPSQKQSGEYLQENSEEEIFHVDLNKKETVWRLPDFTTYAEYDAQGALSIMALMKTNMETLMQLSNRTQAQDVAPSATVYPKKPVEMGDPNVLICFVDQIFPPVLNITWLKNGEVVSQGVMETSFYPSSEGNFRKFSYLPFIPEPGDIYVCKVDHWGLTESLSRLWYSKEPTLLPETTENMVCALGLLMGIVGIVAGTILCFKARQGDGGSRLRGIR